MDDPFLAAPENNFKTDPSTTLNTEEVDDEMSKLKDDLRFPVTPRKR